MNALGWTLVASVREHADGKGIAQRSRRSQRGEVDRPMRLGGHWWFPCGNTRMGKASHRGHGGHRGGRWIDECAWGNTAAPVGQYEEAPGPRTLNAAEKKYLLLISTDLIGL